MLYPVRKFMEAAIEEAVMSREAGDYAIGAVIVNNGIILARGGNRVKRDTDPTAHAEMVAIREAATALDTRHLEGGILYTTHEPCSMCTTAAVWAKMDGIVYGARIEDMVQYREAMGNDEWQWRTIDIHTSEVIERGDQELKLVEGFMIEECRKLFHS